jgi:hypothetical protein
MGQASSCIGGGARRSRAWTSRITSVHRIVTAARPPHGLNVGSAHRIHRIFWPSGESARPNTTRNVRRPVPTVDRVGSGAMKVTGWAGGGAMSNAPQGDGLLHALRYLPTYLPGADRLGRGARERRFIASLIRAPAVISWRRRRARRGERSGSPCVLAACCRYRSRAARAPSTRRQATMLLRPQLPPAQKLDSTRPCGVAVWPLDFDHCRACGRRPNWSAFHHILPYAQDRSPTR